MAMGIINEQAMREIFTRELFDGMKSAAEPILQKALADIEAEMRKRLAAMLVGVIDTSYSLERAGNVIQVRVALGKTAGDAK